MSSSAKPQSEASGAYVRRPRISDDAANALREFCDRNNVSSSDAVIALIAAYDAQMTYRFSGEAAHLMAAMVSLDGSVLALSRTNLEVLAGLRDLLQADYQGLAATLEASLVSTRKIAAAST